MVEVLLSMGTGTVDNTRMLLRFSTDAGLLVRSTTITSILAPRFFCIRTVHDEHMHSMLNPVIPLVVSLEASVQLPTLVEVIPSKIIDHSKLITMTKGMDHSCKSLVKL